MHTDASNAHAPLPEIRVLIAFGLATLLAGANAVAVRFTVAELAPFWGAGIRFVLASAVLWAMLLLRRRHIPSRSELGTYVLYGVIGFGAAYALTYWGLQTVPAGIAQVTLAIMPLLTLMFAVLHGLEQFRWRGLAGALIAVAGIALAFLQPTGAAVSILPMLSILGAAICFAEASVLLKRVKSPDPILSNAVGMTTGTVMLLVFSLLSGETWALPALTYTWLSVIYLALMGSVAAFALSVYVLGHWTASASSYQLVLMPFVTVVLGALLLDEEITSGLLVGGALVLLGVWLGALSSAARRPAREASAPAATEAD